MKKGDKSKISFVTPGVWEILIISNTGEVVQFNMFRVFVDD